MWFKFPKGVEKISIERLEFGVDATDHEGGNYFRAPDHFSSRILALPGFVFVAQPPDGAPADLTKTNSLQEVAISDLTKIIGILKLQVQNLTADLGAASAQAQALTTQNIKLTKQLEEANAKIEELEDEDNEPKTLKTPVLPSPGKSK